MLRAENSTEHQGPFLVLFSLMKEQVFVPKTPNIFAIMTGPPSTIVQVQFEVGYDFKNAFFCVFILIKSCYRFIRHQTFQKTCQFSIFVDKHLSDYVEGPGY